MKPIRVRCPAKINLFLRVGAKDDHGYHPIRTVFQAIDLCDELFIEPAEHDAFACDELDLPADNTVTKALRLLREPFRIPPLSIRLTKTIPVEAGLGGGSSDAAGLLRAAPRLTGHDIPERELMEVASAVGKDVGFFLVGGRARGEGYGDTLYPLDDPSEPMDIVVAIPTAARVSTAVAYARLDSRSEVQLRAAEEIGINDFESVAPADCLELIEFMLRLPLSPVSLCGSGSAAFGIAKSSEAAIEVAEDLKRAGWKAWATSSLSREESLWMS